MNYTKITLGELLSLENPAIRRNATGILKQLQKTKPIETRLKYLRKQIEQENTSYAEIAELQRLKGYIKEDDALLAQWAGIKKN